MSGTFEYLARRLEPQRKCHSESVEKHSCQHDFAIYSDSPKCAGRWGRENMMNRSIDVAVDIFILLL